VNGVRTLSAASSAGAAMTLESCATACAGYNYFGTEYGVEVSRDTTAELNSTETNTFITASAIAVGHV